MPKPAAVVLAQSAARVVPMNPSPTGDARARLVASPASSWESEGLTSASDKDRADLTAILATQSGSSLVVLVDTGVIDTPSKRSPLDEAQTGTHMAVRRCHAASVNSPMVI